MKRALLLVPGLALLALAACKSPPTPTPDTSTAAPDAKPATAASTPVTGKAELGQLAPDFTLTDTDGRTVKLSDFRGKNVVLEWFNPGCPFVKRNHGEGTLKALGNDEAKKGTVWLAINSSAAGKEGAGKDANVAAKSQWAMGYPVLLDENGTVGKAYGATATPHMFVIDKDGKLVYRGAIDNAPDGDPRGGAYENYVGEALQNLRDGKPVAKPETKAYGCSVKYAS